MQLTSIILSGLLGGGGGGGSAASARWMHGVEFFESDVGVSAHATSGIRHLPVAAGNYIAWQFVAGQTGTASLLGLYSMSESNGGTLVLNIEATPVADGEEPTATPTAQAQVSITPGTGTTRKTLTIEVAGLTAGDLVRVKATRGTDTHPGTMNLMGAAE